MVDGVDFTKATKGYNDLEINLKSRPVSDKVTIKNCRFGKGNTNNSISIFGMPEGGVINIENCNFVLSGKSEAVRISNKLDSHQFTINVKDCNYNYPDGFIGHKEYIKKNRRRHLSKMSVSYSLIVIAQDVLWSAHL